MRPQHRLDVIQRSVIREMARYGQEFTVDGPVLRGPGTTAVAIREHPGDDGGHVDLGYVLQLGRADAPVVWDCAAGLGKTEEEQLDNAVRMWATTTASTVVELLERRGEHGDHYRPERLPGWHAVQGPAAVFGFASGPLGEWLSDHQVLPALADALRPEVGEPEPDRSRVAGVKLFLGGRAGEDVAEVRVNGAVSERASAALRSLPWPRGERLCWARLFVLLVSEHALIAGGVEDAAEQPAEPASDRLAEAYGGRRRPLLDRWRQARARRAGR
ncbi:hypothetical protein GCM10010441_28800 [Kitasatospora paracochleata]|uniref:Uncharacterized protein n=1 Tax=Kitasatospora paracochleata TaxID=58354 RepID=A0ABT1IYX7_9ACTN|nr:DUF6348 family protein [Kitasatospora paracochleata]MCP2310358.1 hypothetical protein [Kitasatospora paracochleata]